MLESYMKFKIISTSLIIIFIAIIFMFSNQDGTESKKTSDNFTRSVISIESKVTGKKYTEKQIKKKIFDSRKKIRKTAHFTLYFILGVCAYFTLKSYGVSNKILIYSILLCLGLAIFDEIHQLFSGDRSFKIFDIFIDTCGSSLSNLIIYFISKKKTSKVN